MGKGNFSEDTFDALKHYVSVRLQQGVPLLDSDWNEMDDIRKHELECFLKKFIGNGVPQGDNGFAIKAIPIPGSSELLVESNDFDITPGLCLVDGWIVTNNDGLRYSDQLLHQDSIAADWDVPHLEKLVSPPESVNRADMIFLDVWEREVNIVNPQIGIETCVRLKREWVVRVDTAVIDNGANWAPPTEIVRDGHVYYPLALWERKWSKRPNSDKPIEIVSMRDLRRTNISLAALYEVVNSGCVNLQPGESTDVLVEKNVGRSQTSNKRYIPSISIETISAEAGTWFLWTQASELNTLPYCVNVSYELVYKSMLDKPEYRFGTVDIFLRVVHHKDSNSSDAGPVSVKVYWCVFGTPCY